VQFDAARRFARTWGAPGVREGEFDFRRLWYPYRGDDGHGPLGIAAGPDGTVAVADMANHRVQRFSADGRFLGAFGRRGSGAGELQGPSGLAVGPDGSIYVADTFNHRVQRFGADGRPLVVWPIGEPCGDDEEALPLGIAVAPDGRVFVGDGRPGNPCIMALDDDGRRLTQWLVAGHVDPTQRAAKVNGLAVAPDGTLLAAEHHGTAMIARYEPDGSLLARWDLGIEVYGSYAVIGVAVGPDGTVAVAGGQPDFGVDLFSAEGKLIANIPVGGFADDGLFAQAEGMAVGPDGAVYVADPASNRVQAFEPDGRFRTVIGGARADARGAGEEVVDGALNGPVDVAVAGDGTVYVIDTGRDRVQVFDADGRWLRGWGSRGSGPGEMADPEGIAVGPDDTVYVADSGNHRVQRFTAQGRFLAQWGRWGRAPGELKTPRGIAVAPDGAVRVVDSGNHRVQEFSADGDARYSLGEHGAGDGQLVEPVDVAIGADGATYVTDAGNHRLHRFDACGRVRESWGGMDGRSAAAGRMVAPKGVAVGPSGAVYVADSALRRVQRFAPDGSFDSLFGWQGTEARDGIAPGAGQPEGDVSSPEWIWAGHDGALSLVNTWSGNVQRIGPDGAYLGQWSMVHRSDGELTMVLSATIAPNGTMYVLGTRRPGSWNLGDPVWLHRYTSDGDFLGGAMLQGLTGDSLAFAVAPDGSLLVIVNGQIRRVARFRVDGVNIGWWAKQWPNEDDYPYQLAVGRDGTVYMAVCCDWRMERRSADGTLIHRWGGNGTGPGQFGGACGDCGIRPIVVAPDGTVHAGDMGNQRIQRFTADGAFLGAWGPRDDAASRPRPYLYHYPRAFAIGRDGRAYVRDPHMARVEGFGPDVPTTWHASYYGDRWLSQRALAVGEPEALDFDWGDGPPARYTPADGFSARFERVITLPEGPHDLVVAARGGARVWVDRRLMLDVWDGPLVERVLRIDSPGAEHRLSVEYNDPGGPARLRVDVRAVRGAGW